ncbi:hypothetical protein [Ureibacillus sp. FSL K6-0165]
MRLHGTKDEIEKAIERIEKMFNVVSISNFYADRGKSKLFLVYCGS